MPQTYCPEKELDDTFLKFAGHFFFEEGLKGFGRHACTIRLGRVCWQTAVLTEDDASRVHERIFDGRFPLS